MSLIPVASSEAVSRSMKGNRRRDTRPELRLRSELHSRGRRFRVDFPVALGVKRRPRPDIAFTRVKVAVFVDGCFWHGCPDHGRPPQTNTGYWLPKLEGNRRRDRLDTDLLRAAGWKVVRLWEHTPLEEAVTAVEQALAAQRT